MGVITGYPDDTSTTDSDKFLTSDSSGATKLTSAVTLKSYVLAAGNLTTDQLTNPYKFRVYRTAAANTGNNTFALIAFDTETFDTSNNIASGVFTAPVTGYYQFNWAIQATISAGADETLISALYINGAGYSYGNVITYRNLQGSAGSDLAYMTAGQTADIRAYAPLTRPLNVTTPSVRNYFSGFLVATA